MSKVAHFDYSVSVLHNAKLQPRLLVFHSSICSFQHIQTIDCKNNIKYSNYLKNLYLLESTWSQIGHAPSLLRILLASSGPFYTVKENSMQKDRQQKFTEPKRGK